MVAEFNLLNVRLYTGSVRYQIDVAGEYIKNFIEEHRETDGIDLDPDFQRGHVWKPENQTRYLEHLLRGGESGRTLIWNCPSYEMSRPAPDADAPKELVIVDGKQRLTALLGFLNNEVPVFGGHYLRDFDTRSQREVMSMTGRLRIHMSVHGLQYRKELLQLYIDLNEGAIAHAPEEIERVRALLSDHSSLRIV